MLYSELPSASGPFLGTWSQTSPCICLPLLVEKEKFKE